MKSKQEMSFQKFKEGEWEEKERNFTRVELVDVQSSLFQVVVTPTGEGLFLKFKKSEKKNRHKPTSPKINKLEYQPNG